MKKFYSLILGCIAFVTAYAQAPQLINYQGVARNISGGVLADQAISIRIIIHDGTASGTAVYSETRNLTTNSFGLFSYTIGAPGAANVTGTIAGIDWASGSKFLEVDIDPKGGSTYVLAGTSQLLSVPYALHSGAASPTGAAAGSLSGTYPNPVVAKIRNTNVSATAPTTNQVLLFNGTDWTPANSPWINNGVDIVKNGTGKVGINTVTPANDLHIKQTLPNKAIQWQHETQADFWTVGIGTNTLNCRFEFNGALRGQISSVDGAFVAGSDLRLKEDIVPVAQLLKSIMQLKPYTYYYKDSRAFAQHRSIGFLAQDIEKSFPELVYEMDGGMKGLNYAGFSVLAIKAIQEIQPVMEAQEARIKSLEERLARLEAVLNAKNSKKY